MVTSYDGQQMTANLEYEEVPKCNEQDALAALERGDPNELGLVVIGLALHNSNRAFVEGFCLNLANHCNEIVKGNSVLGFGHIARRFGELSDPRIRQIIESALADKSEYVRGQAWAAAEDTAHFLGWTIVGFDKSRS